MHISNMVFAKDIADLKLASELSQNITYNIISIWTFNCIVLKKKKFSSKKHLYTDVMVKVNWNQIDASFIALRTYLKLSIK